MRYPDGYLWQFPGFYSVSVPYGMANNFFFCPQLGLCVIIACELHAMGCPKLAIVTMFVMVYQTLLLIFLRGNYLIDIVSSIIFGHYFW